MALRRRGGSWIVDIRITHPHTGETHRLRRSCGKGTTKKEAQKKHTLWRRELRASFQQPKLPELDPTPPPAPEPASKTFPEFAWHWYRLHTVPNCKPSTQRVVEGVLRKHAVPFFGAVPLGSVTSERIAHYKADKVTGLAPKTVNNHLGVLSRMYRSAVEWGYVERNPVTGVGLLKLPPQEFAFWDAAQSERFLTVIQATEPSHYPFFLTALRTGMRMGELVALEWSHVDLALGRIDVRWSVHRGERTSPKNGRGRSIPLSPRLAEVLARQRQRCGRSPLVFPCQKGGYLTRDKVKRPMWRAIERARLPRIRFHDLRHSFASQLVMAGVPLVAIQQYLGHADLTMTMRYSHLSPAARQDYIKVLDGVR